jgi:hypothetical protein
MEEKRLPKNGKEGFLYGSIICLITVIIMLVLNIGTAFGKLDGETLLIVIKLVPIIWIVAMLIESLIIGKISEKLVVRFADSSDGFNARILFNILFCVTGMSASMTIIGGLIGNGLSLEPFQTFFSHWPRNFFVAFWCEILLAQPIARFVMKKLHTQKCKAISETSLINE